MVLAFRLYGDFHWPPGPGKAPAEPLPPGKTKQGIVEVHFAGPEGVVDHRPLLRWIPRSLIGDSSETPEEPAKSLFDLSPHDLTKWFEDSRDTGGTLWLGGTPGGGINRTFVIFRGGFLFEQYDSEEMAGDKKPKLDVQWPLVTRCEYKIGTPVYSVLGLHYHQKPLLYLNLHLPFPVRRTSLSDSTHANSSFFPFSAVFDLTPGTKDSLIRIDRLIAGWKQNDLMPKLNAAEETCFPFQGANNPEILRLGAFGFSEYGGAGDRHFAVYGLNHTETGKYWPLNRQSLIQDILWRYGFALDYDDTEWLQTADIGVADSSLRFVSPRDGKSRGRGTRSSLIYRTSVKRRPDQGAPSPPTTEDLQADGSILRLLLAHELGGRRALGTQFGAADTANEKEEAEKIAGWLRIGAVLSADCEFSWEIAPQDIWTEDRTTDWSPTIAIWLHWEETLPPAELNPRQVEPQLANGSKDFRAGLLAHAHQSFRAVRAALEPGEAGRPHSFLPNLFADTSQDVRFALYGSPLAARFRPQGDIVWGRSPKPEPTDGWRRPPMRLGLAGKDDLIDAVEKPTDLKVTAETVTFFQPGWPIDPQPVTISLTLSHDENWRPQGADAIDDGDPFFASFITKALAQKAWQGRLASLQFSGASNEPSTSRKGHLRIGGRGAQLGFGDGAPTLLYPHGRIAVQLRLALPAATVAPVGVDVARTDRTGRPGPLLIPLDASRNTPTTNLFWLIATETLSPTQDRQIEAVVSEDSPDTGAKSYVVLSSEPFSIFRFRHQPLSDRGTAETASVAFYSGDDRIWQYRRVSDFYHYVFPPQSVGESADKPRRLEIHDLPDAASEVPPRPLAPALPAPSVERRRAVEFRLTPSAEIWVRPSDVERGYFMPEATSYEIFRQHGQYGLGAALAYLRAEFLYGMPVGIDVSQERSIARGARVTEIEALTGRLTGPAREPDAEPRLLQRWNAVRSAVARRPERLEIWARDLDSAVDFTPARFSDGVRFALRHSALHRSPLIDRTSIKDEGLSESADDFNSPPRIAGLLPSAVPPTLESNPRHHPQGLSGGALWPVESLNLFRTMLQSPQSSGGTIESIALSPIGGDATQKAEFLGGKVIIISDTRNGHVERQQVEVLGRICALWHRAKHVVVYERTVNPSAQFAPKKAEDPDRTRSRRPILRKVREYIEILQPERSYPDFSTAAARSAGFLERVRFNSIIINVDSAWASEVGTFGWQIPLWNRLSARERPQVYPMPDVAFVSTAEGDGDKPVVAQECLDPDYLFFFADVSTATTADTDTWESRLNLDFPNLPLAHEIALKADAKSSADPNPRGNSEGRRRSVGRILPGMRRFTWRLAPAAQKAAVNAGRSGKPVYAGIESISFMRATHSGAGQGKLPENLGRILEGVAAVPDPGPVEQTLSKLPYWEADGNGASVNEAQAYLGKKQAIISAINNKDVTDLKNKLAELDAFLTDAGGGETFAKKIADKIVPGDLGLGPLKDVASGLKKGRRFCATLKTNAVETIQRKELLVRMALQDWTAQADELIAAIEPYANDATKDQAIAELKKLAVEHIRPIFTEASKDVAEVEEGVEKAHAALLDLQGEIDAVVERARQRVAQFVSGYDQTKPWSAGRRKAFRDGLEACLGNIRDDILAAIEETRQRLGVELNEVSQAIGGHISKTLSAIDVIETDALGRITTLQFSVDRAFAKIDKTIAHLLSASGEKTLDDLIAKVQASSVDNTLKVNAVTALQTLKNACTSAKTKIAEAGVKAKEVDATADEALADVKVAVQTLADAMEEVGVALVQALADIKALSNDFITGGEQAIADAFSEIFDVVSGEIKVLGEQALKWINEIGSQIDAVVLPAAEFLDSILLQTGAALREIPQKVLPVIQDVKRGLQEVQAALRPDQLLEQVVKEQVIGRALIAILAPLPERVPAAEVEAAQDRLKAALDLLTETAGQLIHDLTENLLGGLNHVTTACDALFEGAAEVEDYVKGLATDAKAYIQNALGPAFTTLQQKIQAVTSLAGDVSDLIAAVQGFDYAVRGLQNNLARAHQTARAYGARVMDQFGKLDEGGLLAAPSNILKLYSAVTSAPELAALKADIDRIRAGFDELNDIIDTTKSNALFNRLGDELKALGLSLPFDKIGDRLLPADLSNLDIRKVFRNFGGAKLDNLLKGYKLPAGVNDAVRVTHDFDKKQARAWVQVDIDAPMPGRRSLFSVGVFKADFVDMQLTGQVRLEASKDQEKVTETGYGRIGTVVDLVVGGQSMVRFEKFGLSFTKEKGLDVEFDPKNIRLNPSFQFIQDFLSTIFPDEIGGLEIIKENGIPVGVQHEFAMPPMALNFGTSGVQNISISNHFKLLAFPDFMLANRFNLSTVERPFIFAIFIIGGTGYIQIDAEYRPFDGELMVAVEAGAGGSASLAFSFGPFTGQVFITLSGALTYRKVIGRPGGGLSISAILVIAGHVSVAGIVTVGIVLILRMTYRDNGQIDADGSLTVTIRISKFFKLTARANAKYKLRGGKSETVVTTSTDTELDPAVAEKAKKLKAAADKLEKARS